MATNFVQDGDILTLTAPYTRTAGQGALIGTALFGVAITGVASGALAAFQMCGIHTLPKTSAQAWTVGALIYWDNSQKECTTTSGGNTLIGVAVAVADNPSATGQVRLYG